MVVDFVKTVAAAAALLCFSVPAAAQDPAQQARTIVVRNGGDGALSPTEERVREILKRDGIHVVHFWSPWCENAISEFRKGWFELIENNGDVMFTFVTIWNDGEVDEHVLEDYVIPDRVETLGLPDYGPSAVEANRRRSFLGLPLTWTPSTWIFHQNGELAFAMNYGEMGMAEVQPLIDITRQKWNVGRGR